MARRWESQVTAPRSLRPGPSPAPAPPPLRSTCRGQERRCYQAEGRHVLHLGSHCRHWAEARALRRRQQGRLVLQDLWEGRRASVEDPVAGSCSGSLAPAWLTRCAGCTPGPGTYRGGIGSAGPERQRRRVEGTQLAGHLLHPPQCALAVRVCQLDHEARRGALGKTEEAVRTGLTPSSSSGPSALLIIRPFPRVCGEKQPVPTPLASPWPQRPPSPPLSGCRADSGWLPELPLDSRTSQRHSLGQDRGGSGHRGQRVLWSRVRQGSSGNPGVSSSHLY